RAPGGSDAAARAPARRRPPRPRGHGGARSGSRPHRDRRRAPSRDADRARARGSRTRPPLYAPSGNAHTCRLESQGAFPHRAAVLAAEKDAMTATAPRIGLRARLSRTAGALAAAVALTLFVPGASLAATDDVAAAPEDIVLVLAPE